MRFTLIMLLVAIASEASVIALDWDRRGIHQYCSDVSKRQHWVLSSEGYTQNKPLVSPSISFSAPQKLILDDARRMIVFECERLLQMARRTQTKKVCLVAGQFNITNISFSAYFSDPLSDQRYELPYVAGFVVSKGRIFYISYNSQTKKFADIHIEPYEEAVRIVEAEQAVECFLSLSNNHAE